MGSGQVSVSAITANGLQKPKRKKTIKALLSNLFITFLSSLEFDKNLRPEI
jgi:hypothetical protein